MRRRTFGVNVQRGLRRREAVFWYGISLIAIAIDYRKLASPIEKLYSIFLRKQDANLNSHQRFGDNRSRISLGMVQGERYQRFGAIGKHGSIAVTERVILTYKDGCTRRILVPISHKDMIAETELFFEWYNEHRPHMSLGGKTPNETYFGLRAANAKPRIETRPLAKHSTPCAKPRMCFSGKVGAKIRVRLEFLEGRLHLPILKVERV